MHSKRLKHFIFVALSFSLAGSVIIQAPQAEAAKRRSGGGGGGGGGVFLKTPDPVTPVDHNNRGVELGQHGLWPDAIHEHEIALTMDPNNIQWRTNLSAAHLEYGKFLAGKGKKGEACAEFRRAMIIDPANAQADAELDNVLAKLGRNPLDYNYRAGLADDADVAGQYDTAIVEWRRCVKMRDNGSTRAHLGRVLIKAGKAVEGYKELRTSVAANWPSDDESRRELADTHRQLGDILKEFALKAKDLGKGTKGMQRLANAAIEYRRAVTVYPGNGAAIEGILQCGQMALAIKPSFDNHLFMGGAYLLAGKFPNAQMEYKECYKLNPNRPELAAARIAFHQAVARMATASPEQVAESVATVKKLIDDDQDNARLWYILGRLREHQSDYEKAKKCYDQAAKINPLIDPDLKVAMVRIGAAPPPDQAPKEVAKSQEQSKEALQKAMKEKDYNDLQNLVESGGNLDDAVNKGQELFGKNQKDGRYPGLVGRAYEKKANTETDPEKKTEALNNAKSWYRIGAGLNDESSMRFLEQIDASRVADKAKEADDLFKSGKFIEAKSVYQDILIMAPRRGDMHRKLGDCMKELGDKEGYTKEYADADVYDKGGSPKPTSLEDKTPIGGSPSDSGSDAEGKKAIADKSSKGKKGKSDKVKEAEKPPAEQGLSADALQMPSLKPKK